MYIRKKGEKVSPFFLSPFLCRLLHAFYNSFVCRNGNHLQILISASGCCFRLLYEPSQSRSSLLRSQTNDGCMPCHHHGTVGDTGNLHQCFLYPLGSFLWALGHCRKACGCLLSRTAAEEETERKNNIFSQNSTPISLFNMPRKTAFAPWKIQLFFPQKNCIPPHFCATIKKKADTPARRDFYGKRTQKTLPCSHAPAGRNTGGRHVCDQSGSQRICHLHSGSWRSAVSDDPVQRQKKMNPMPF